MSDATRPGAPDAPRSTSPTAATLVRVLASVVDLVATDHDPVAHEMVVQRAVEAGAAVLAGLAESDPERTSEGLDVLAGVVEDLPGEDPTLYDRWRQQVRTLTPALATARQVVSRMEVLVDEFTRLAATPAPATATLAVVPGPSPRPSPTSLPTPPNSARKPRPQREAGTPPGSDADSESGRGSEPGADPESGLESESGLEPGP